METARIWKFGDDVDTDQIIASQYIILPSIDEMMPHAFESLHEGFAGGVKAGDAIVAGDNFGCGSSREQAPRVLKALGVRAIVAKSVARIFYRNAINIGLPVILCEGVHDVVAEGDEIELDFEDGLLFAAGKEFSCTKLPQHMQNILAAGGLINWLNAQETPAASLPKAGVSQQTVLNEGQV